ncbi:MAG: hypothetical protein JWL92_384 [Candidatus Nomurabacteria bacterium]|nr:hypothetical protein [Candidatus Nomurabacteria bacterium]
MKTFYWILGVILLAAVLGYVINRSSIISEQTTTSPIPTNIPKNNYANKTLGISVNVPAGYTTDESYKYQMAPRQTIPGVKFTIPAALAKGTNLSTDTYVSVEKLNDKSGCSADRFLDGSHNATIQTINGMNYSIASAEGAGAGNRYQETVYALQSNTCVAVRYFIHYSAFENYPKGSIKEFDQAATLKSLDQIRDSLVII